MKTREIIATAVLAGCAIFAWSREAYTINDGWSFTFGSDSLRTEAVHLPHCWNEDAYSTRDYRRGRGIYRKELKIPERLAGERIYLRLDGAATQSEVFIDGKRVGQHLGAYSPHTLDITPYVTPGKSHLLSVAVDNADANIPPYSADFTFMGGLYRDVWLIAANPVHLSFASGRREGIKAMPLLLENGVGRLDTEGELVNTSKGKRSIVVTGILLDPDGRERKRISKRMDLKPGEDRMFQISFGDLEDIWQWSPETPELYTLVTEISDMGKVIDRTHTPVGFRSFGFDSAGRFLLNGKPYKLRGMCRHQDQRPMGIALSDEQHRRDIALVKDMGGNFIRISHYPQDDAVLEMCDRLGLIAWEEIPVIDYVPDNPSFAENSERMLREMIRSHYNHPSIAMWGYMNEILLRSPLQGEESERRERARQLADRLEGVVREEDPSRLSTMAFHGSDIYHDAGLSEITDVKGWNLYQGWYGGRLEEFGEFLSRQHREHPDHRLIVSEYGAGSDLRIHSLDPEPFDFSMEYQQLYLENYLPVIEDSAFVAGASHWNLVDFSSANRAESMPHINNKGLLTNDRRKKDVYHYFRAAWIPLDVDTIAHIASRDWAARTEIASADTVIRPIKVYSNLPAVRLAVNGIMLPALDVENHNAVFDVPLRDGKNILQVFSGNDTRTPLDVMTVEVKLIKARDGKLYLDCDELAMNVGSNCYFRSDESGLTWLPDREYREDGLYGYVGGTGSVTQDDIALTSDTPLYQHNMTGIEEYKIDLADGRYEVELGFADHSSPSALSAYMLGHNVGRAAPFAEMDIQINGELVEEAFSPARDSGVKRMVRRRYETEVSDGNGITVGFVPREGITILSTLKIRRLP